MRLEPSISGVHVEGGPNPVRSMEFSLSSIERVDYLRQGSFNLRSGSFSLILPGSRRRPVQLLLVRPAMCYIAAFKLLACAALSAVTWSLRLRVSDQAPDGRQYFRPFLHRYWRYRNSPITERLGRFDRRTGIN